jgi:hypothetical protein
MKPEKSILVNFIISCVLTLAGWFFVIAPQAKVQDLIKRLPGWINTNVVENFPDDLTINIKNGIVSLNKPSPYCLTLPSDKTSKNEELSGIVFDVKATADISSLESGGKYSKLCKAFALVGKDFVLHPDKDNTYRYTKISETVSFDIDRTVILKYVTQYMPLVINFGQRAYFIIPFSFIPLFFVILLSTNYWYSLVVRFAAKILKIKELSFGESFKLSLYFYNFILLVDAILIKYVLNILLEQNINITFPFLNTIVITAAAMIYLKNKTPPENPITVAPPIPGTPMGMTPTQASSSSTPTGQ